MEHLQKWEGKLLKTLTVSLYNREEYTKRLLEHLNQCYDIENYDITICCEPGFKVIEKLAKDFRPTQTEVVVNNRRYGCNTNIYLCLAIGFSKNDYHIHFEDDTIPGKDCLLYFEWARELYKNNKDILTISGYVNSNNQTEHFYPLNEDLDCVFKRKWFTPWGWATWKDRFKEMEDVWDFQGKNGSWDYTINHIVRRDRYEISPAVSRIQNIGGEMGTHVPNSEWHSNHHLNLYWIETLNKYPETYKEIV
jgi:hypothetical protein